MLLLACYTEWKEGEERCGLSQKRGMLRMAGEPNMADDEGAIHAWPSRSGRARIRRKRGMGASVWEVLASALPQSTASVYRPADLVWPER